MVIGWKEQIALPDWEVPAIVAKCDTGAKSSAIDVENLQEISEGRVRFELVYLRDRKSGEIQTSTVETDVYRMRKIRPSNGVLQKRFTVLTRVEIGGEAVEVEFSLVRRAHMLCRVLLGRRALAGNFIVDAEHRYVLSESPNLRQKRLKSPL